MLDVPIATGTLSNLVICCKKGSIARLRMVITAPRDDMSLHSQQVSVSDYLAMTFRHWSLRSTYLNPTDLSSDQEPHGPRLASSKTSRSDRGLTPRLSLIHFRCPMAAPSAMSSADLDIVESVDIRALMVMPNGH